MARATYWQIACVGFCVAYLLAERYEQASTFIAAAFIIAALRQDGTNG